MAGAGRMHTLLVSPYPPERDGIASYAFQLAKSLRSSGERVTVLSPSPSAAHLHLAYGGPRGSVALGRRVRSYDKVVLQYHPMYHYDSDSFARRTATDLLLGEALRLAKQSVVYIHELEYDEFRLSTSRQRAAEFLWRSSDSLVFHSQFEMDKFRELFPAAAARALIADHGRSFFRRTHLDRAAARSSLGLNHDAFVFLAIGFIQRHKGFDRAIRAFAGLHEHGATLSVVGSCRSDEPEFLAYLAELRSLEARTPGVQVCEGYVSDEMFDRWILASDVVVLPYRQIWSSGVLERAKLYDTPVIATRVGGLDEQADTERTTLVGSDDALRAAMSAALGVPTSRTPQWAVAEDAPWQVVQEELRRRAALVSDPATPIPRGHAGGPSLPPASYALRNVPRYLAPPTSSKRPGVGTVKRLVNGAVSWRIDPLARHVETLRVAAVTAVDELQERLDDLDSA
jgi:glycosyltransferase involved in cell wall biosynthesis